jgi:hypothetical protein
VTRAPWSRTKAARTVLSPDEEWAAGIRARILGTAIRGKRDAVDDPARRISLLVGRGGAKTTTKRARAIIKLVSLRNQFIGYAATSADQARDLNWNKLKSACEAYEIRSEVTSTVSKVPDVSFLDTKMILTCNRTGSVYRLRGVEDKRDAEKFRGFAQAEFQVDECGSFPPELLEYLVDQCVAPRLGEALALDGGRGGCIVLGSTPPPTLRGIFYEVTREGSKRHRRWTDRDKQKPDGSPEFPNWKGYSSHSWTLKDVVDLPDGAERYPALVANWETGAGREGGEGLGRRSPDLAARIPRAVERGQHEHGVPVPPAPHRRGREARERRRGRGMEPVVPARRSIRRGHRGIEAGARGPTEGDDGTGFTWHFALACDDGGRDPFACNVFAFAPADQLRRIFHVYAFEATNMYPTAVANYCSGPIAT